MRKGVLEQLRAKARRVWEEKDLLETPVEVRARTLSVEEAIGDPEGDDFPLQKGKERLMEAVVGQGRGQAFTDRFGDFSGTLGQVADMDLDNNYRRAVFVAVLNAVQSDLGMCAGAVHCRDKEPGRCARRLVERIREEHGSPRIALVGFQPAMVEQLAANFELRVLDLDPDNIGQTLRGALIEGAENTGDAVDWADLLLVTGSTLANDTIGRFITEKPTWFFGTTIAGACGLMGWDRYCMMSDGV